MGEVLVVDESSKERLVRRKVATMDEEALPIVPLLVDVLDNTLAKVKDVEVLTVEKVVVLAVEIAFSVAKVVEATVTIVLGIVLVVVWKITFEVEII